MNIPPIARHVRARDSQVLLLLFIICIKPLDLIAMLVNFALHSFLLPSLHTAYIFR